MVKETEETREGGRPAGRQRGRVRQGVSERCGEEREGTDLLELGLSAVLEHDAQHRHLQHRSPSRWTTSVGRQLLRRSEAVDERRPVLFRFSDETPSNCRCSRSSGEQ